METKPNPEEKTKLFQRMYVAVPPCAIWQH